MQFPSIPCPCSTVDSLFGTQTGWLLSSQVVDAESGVWKGALEKHFSMEALSLLGQHLGVQDGDLVLLAIARSSDLSTVDRTLEKVGRVFVNSPPVYSISLALGPKGLRGGVWAFLHAKYLRSGFF